MNAVGVLLGLHSKVGFIFSVDESREPQNASGFGGRRIASEFACHGTQQGFAVSPVNTLDRQSDQTDESLYGCIRLLRCPSCFDFRPSSLGWLLCLVDRTVIEGVASGS